MKEGYHYAKRFEEGQRYIYKWEMLSKNKKTITQKKQLCYTSRIKSNQETLSKMGLTNKNRVNIIKAWIRKN